MKNNTNKKILKVVYHNQIPKFRNNLQKKITNLKKVLIFLILLKTLINPLIKKIKNNRIIYKIIKILNQIINNSNRKSKIFSQTKIMINFRCLKIQIKMYQYLIKIIDNLKLINLII